MEEAISLKACLLLESMKFHFRRQQNTFSLSISFPSLRTPSFFHSLLFLTFLTFKIKGQKKEIFFCHFQMKVPFLISPNRAVCFQVRKLKGSDEHLSVERAAGGQDVLVSC